MQRAVLNNLNMGRRSSDKLEKSLSPEPPLGSGEKRWVIIDGTHRLDGAKTWKNQPPTGAGFQQTTNSMDIPFIGFAEFSNYIEYMSDGSHLW